MLYCCYVAVCSAAEGASAPMGRRGAGHTVAATRLQLVLLLYCCCDAYYYYYYYYYYYFWFSFNWPIFLEITPG